MRIQFLYWEDCPSPDLALERLKQVMAEEKVSTEIEILEVENDEQARQWHFTGSPTIIINDQDIDPPPNAAHAALTCRVYHWDDGRISPLPSPDMIRRALHAAQTK